MNYPLRLAPGQTEGIPVEGDFFCVTSTPIDIEISVDGRGKATYNQGDTRTLTGGRMFRRLEIRNPSARAIDVIIFAGTDRYSQSRHAIMEPRTEAAGVDMSSVAAGDTVELAPSLSGMRTRRKAIIVSNRDPGADLLLRDMNNNVVGVISGGERQMFPISETVNLHNAGGAPVPCAVGEIYWLG